MGDCIAPAAVSNFAAKDANRIVGKIGEVLIRKSPYIDILGGGTLPNVSDVVRSLVQERAVLAASLAAPMFTPDVNMCGANGGNDQVGSTAYTFQLESLRGNGPRVCVKTSRTAFKGSYLQAQMALEKGILQIMNADIRSTLHVKSGVKFVCRSDKPFSTLVTGDMQQINTQFYQQLPNSPLSFRMLWKLGALLREDLLAEPFESDQGTMFKFIGSVDAIENFRNELNIKDDLHALTTGRYQLGEKSLDSYEWSGPYRGFGFAIDSQPLRCTGFDGNGNLVLVEPEIGVATSQGVAARRNPAWVTAPYEVGFVLAADSFNRLVPESYVGEGTFKFAPQLAAGELEWLYIRDNDCNRFGDYGQHIYQISRAYQPVRPHAVIPILYQRCQPDLNATPCGSSITGL